MLIAFRYAAVFATVMAGAGCNATPSAAPTSTSAGCRGPVAGGVGLLAGTVTISGDGRILRLQPRPEPLYTPAPGDVDLPLIPGSILIVRHDPRAASSNPQVLPLWSEWATPLQPNETAFRAGASGCSRLPLASGATRLIAVRSPTS